MAGRYNVVSATEAHAVEMAPAMKDADVQEVWASTHYNPEKVLLMSLRGSSDARAGLVDGRVMWMTGFGDLSLLSGQGVPWLLSTSEIESHVRFFLRETKAYLAEMRPRYTSLLNFVDARHTAALRWMTWLGFEMFPAQPFGVDQLPFHLFKIGGE